jgi:hypothetical protein
MKRIGAIGKQSFMNCNWGYAYAEGFVVLAEGLYMLRLGANCTCGKMNQSGNLSFTKRALVGWMSGG